MRLKYSFTLRKSLTGFIFREWRIILIFLLGLLIYSNTFHAAFHFDDEGNIISNLAIRNFWNLKDIWNVFPTRFVTYFSFAFNYHLHQLSLPGYHIFNLVVHLGTAMLVSWFVLLLLSVPALKDAPITGHAPLSGLHSTGYARVISLLSGLIFVSHPVQIQAVTYIIQRTASLAAFFYLLSVCLYVKSRLSQPRFSIPPLPRPATGKTPIAVNKAYYIGSVLAAAAALFTKETAATLPFMLLLCDFFFFRDNFKNIIKRLAPFLLILAVLITLWTFRLTGFTEFSKIKTLQVQELQPGETAISPDQYLLTQFRVIVTYIRLLLIPINQNLDYDYPVAKTLWTVSSFSSLLFLLSILTAATLLFRKHRILSFSIFWFFLALVPESSILPIIDVIFEHRLYLPMVGYCLFLPIAAYSLAGDKRRKSALILLLALIACYSVMTYTRNRIWKDELTLWSDVVKKSPNKARPYLGKGMALNDKGEYDQAISVFVRAITIQPNYAEAYNNRGFSYFYKKEYDKAITDFNQAIKIQPNFQDAYNNRGAAYYAKGEHDKAASDFQVAIKTGLPRLSSYYNLIEIFKKEGAEDKLVELYPKILALKQDAVIHNELGVLYSKRNMVDQALQEFKSAVELKPTDAKYRNNLGIAYMQKGERAKALTCWEEALRLAPDLKEARENLNKVKR